MMVTGDGGAASFFFFCTAPFGSLLELRVLILLQRRHC